MRPIRQAISTNMWLAAFSIFLALSTQGLALAQAKDVSYDLEYAGALDGGARLPCVDYFVLRHEATKCEDLLSSVAGIKGEMCETVAGPMLAIYSPETDRHHFTARIVGPQVVLLPLASCSITKRVEKSEKGRDVCDASVPVHTSASYALLAGLLPGSYAMSVTLLYSGFSYGIGVITVNSKSGTNETLTAMTADVTVSKPTARNAAASKALISGYEECTYCPAQKATWPICSSSSIEGSWLTGLPAADPTIPATLATQHNPNLLHWQPKGCHFVPLENIDVKRCLMEKKKHVCFVGDSQSRHMYDGFVDAMNKPASNTRRLVGQEATKVVKTIKTVYKSDYASYILMTFGDGWVNEQLDVCDVVFMNFGQWPLSHVPASRWSVSHYATVLSKMIASIKAYQAKHTGTRFYWASTNYHTITHIHFSCAANLDYRLPPFVELFNRVAHAKMAMSGIPTVDTGLLTSHLVDLSYDGAHFHWEGSVGHYINEFISNVVCVQA